VLIYSKGLTFIANEYMSSSGLIMLVYHNGLIRNASNDRHKIHKWANCCSKNNFL